MHRVPKFLATVAFLTAWAASAAVAHRSVCALSAVPSDIRDSLFLCAQSERQLAPAIPFPEAVPDTPGVKITPWPIAYPWPAITNPVVIKIKLTAE